MWLAKLVEQTGAGGEELKKTLRDRYADTERVQLDFMRISTRAADSVHQTGRTDFYGSGGSEGCIGTH